LSDGRETLVDKLIARRGVRQFVKFGIVGLSGLLVNLLCFTVLQQLTPVDLRAQRYSLLFGVSFLAGGLSNYALNRVWTFRSTGPAMREGVQFMAVSLLAMFVGIGAKWLLSPYIGTGHKMWFVSTLAGIFVNFFANKYWTFRTSASGA
jgi:putative flippase GtrA